jgi:hypothetical protein
MSIQPPAVKINLDTVEVTVEVEVGKKVFLG